MCLALLCLHLHMHSAVIMSQEHSVLLFWYLLLLFRVENLCRVLSHGQAGVSARAAF